MMVSTYSGNKLADDKLFQATLGSYLLDCEKMNFKTTSACI